MTDNIKKTKAAAVLENLRHDIIRGVYPAGARLQMEDLKERYGVGYSPLREALFQLTASGLVVVEEHCGFTVSPLSREELHDLYRMRMMLEVEGLELAMENGDDQWEADVLASWHCFSKYLASANKNKISPDVWNKLQADYFTSLVKACNSPWLMKLSQVLFDQSERYRYACLGKNSMNKKVIAEYLQENEKLVAAALKRDRKQAVSILQSLWQQSLAAIEEAL